MKQTLVGRTFGRLTVLRKMPSDGRSNAKYLCMCECGNEKLTTSNRLSSGCTQSCGCLHRESARDKSIKHRKHGLHNTPTYKSWQSMFGRCCDKNNRSFKYYGAKGVKVCERWRSFENFFADMGLRPEGMTLDRIDTTKDYEPENCRWATPSDQANNRSNNVRLMHGGSLISLAQFARQVGLTHSGATYRLRKNYAKNADGFFELVQP